MARKILGLSQGAFPQTCGLHPLTLRPSVHFHFSPRGAHGALAVASSGAGSLDTSPGAQEWKVRHPRSTPRRFLSLWCIPHMAQHLPGGTCCWQVPVAVYVRGRSGVDPGVPWGFLEG